MLNRFLYVSRALKKIHFCAFTFRHKQWRALIKKMKRKNRRQKAAQERDARDGEEEASEGSDDEQRRYEKWRFVHYGVLLCRISITSFPLFRKEQNELWKEREWIAQQEFKIKMERAEKERKRREEEEVSRNQTKLNRVLHEIIRALFRNALKRSGRLSRSRSEKIARGGRRKRRRNARKRWSHASSSRRLATQKYPRKTQPRAV